MKKHIELNEHDSYYTANATYFFGETHMGEKDENFLDAFLSISDCYNTIRLHPNTRNFNNEEMKKFKNKLKKLSDFINDFHDNLPEDIEAILFIKGE